MIQIYDEMYKQEIIDLILYVQNEEFGLGNTIDNLQDLLDIYINYIHDGGGFWVALNESGEFIGSIGLQKRERSVGVLKRFFVYKEYRGKESGVGLELYNSLLNYAKEKGIRKIILDTPSVAKRAHNFYNNVGFKEITPEDLPIEYTYTKLHSPKLFLLEVE